MPNTVAMDSSKYIVLSPAGFLYILVITCRLWSSQGATSICTPYTGNNTVPLPNISGNYEAQMEWWDTATQTFHFRQEVVDHDNNMAAVKVFGAFDPNDEFIFISDYNTDQLFAISMTPKGKVCHASSIPKMNDEETFPYVLVSNKTQKRIVSTHTLLGFGTGFHEHYAGRTTRVRGKVVDLWTGCFHDNLTDSQVKTEYFFSAPDWFPSNSEVQVPLRSIFTTYTPGRTHSFDFTKTVQIDYVYFSLQLRDTSIFQEASGVPCPMRKSTLPVPKLPSHFQFRSELIMPLQQEIQFYDEIYDRDSKLVVIESTIPSAISVASMEGFERRKAVLDCQFGISYLISSETGYCDITPITPDDFNTRVIGRYIRMATAEEFAKFDLGNFVYSGQRTIRGIDCNSWTGQTTNFPSGLKNISYWTWYFKMDSWTSALSDKQTQVPVYLEISIPEKGLEFWYNIYDFTVSTHVWENVDVSACFHHTEKRMIQFKLLGKLETEMNFPRNFTLQMIQLLATVMQVSVLRISNFKCDLGAVSPTVSFTLLEAPKVKGDVEPLKSDPTSLEEAVIKLNDTINYGLVFLRLQVKNPQGKEEILSVYAIVNSLRQRTLYSNGTLETLDPLSEKQPQCSCNTSSTNPPSPNILTSPSKQFISTSTQIYHSLPNTIPSSRKPAMSTIHTKSSSATSSHTSPDKHRLCDKGKDNSQWTTGKLVGLCVGVAVVSVLVGVLAVGLVQGWARPRLRHHKSKGFSIDSNGTSSYSMM